MTPPNAQVINMKDGEGSASAIKPVVINIPEPITIPITIMVLSNRPNCRLSLGDASIILLKLQDWEFSVHYKGENN